MINTLIRTTAFATLIAAGTVGFTAASFAQDAEAPAEASGDAMSDDAMSGDAAASGDAMSSDTAASSDAASGDMPMVGGAPMDPSKTIVENASAASNLSTLVAAVKAAGLAETLSGEGPFTVFAPTNEAFEALPEGTVDDLLKPENKERLASILTYHVVPAEATSEAAMQMIEDDGGEHPATTVEGGEITLSMDGENIIVTDAQGNEATVTQADVMQSNGVVHVIDTVLMPAE